MNRRDAIKTIFGGLAFAGLCAAGLTPAERKPVLSTSLLFRIKADAREAERSLTQMTRAVGRLQAQINKSAV